MQYEAPKLEVIELDETDIIQTSEIGAGGDNELPPYIPTSLDGNVN